ncbi:hypothetical protein BDV27DRAFT_127691, partial [Aspergillus caelatus]
MREMSGESFEEIMGGSNGGGGRTAAGFVVLAFWGDQGSGMFSRLVEAYGQDRYGYEGQERDDEMGWAPEPVNESNVGGNRGARDGSEDAQRGGSGSGGASMTPDEAMDKGMRLCSKRDDHWRGIVDCYFRIEGHFHAIQDLYRQIHYYTGCYPHRIECYSAY